ncbi:MAG: hypothetical protein HY392_03850 [Candidatus Diapherotrites archaeon]|nr:hypothetical protein [Candidatus Diapherotrites archaeon]
MKESFVVDNRVFFVVEKISKGYTSDVFLVEDKNHKRFALKAEKQKSPRRDMAGKEALHLLFVNGFGIGPALECFDTAQRVVVLELVDGMTFDRWLFQKNPSKKVLSAFVEELLEQGGALDRIGISHGQLAGKGRNILVAKNRPVIIDFEKASSTRRCRNENQLRALLFENPGSAVAKKVREILNNGKNHE